jgi:hypothetical protein
MNKSLPSEECKQSILESTRLLVDDGESENFSRCFLFSASAKNEDWEGSVGDANKSEISLTWSTSHL